MWISFCISPSSRRETGMPVQRATTSAISSASTSSFKQGAFGLQLFAGAFRLRPRLASSSRSCRSAGGPPFPGRLCVRPAPSPVCACSICSLMLRSSAMASFSVCQRVCSWPDCSRRSASSCSSFSRRSLRGLILFFLQGLALDLELHDLAVDLVQLPAAWN